MSSATSWWRDLSGPVKFRLYTKATFQGGTVVGVIAVAITNGGTLSLIGIVVAGVAAVAALEGQPQLASWSSPAFRRWVMPLSATVVTGIWAAAAFAAHTTDSETGLDAARSCGLYATMLGFLSLIAFTRFRWWLVVAVSVATGIAFGTPSGNELGVFAVTLGLGLFVVIMTLLTLWSLKVVDDLERAKGLGADLQLAEERLRFARDLHDVVGRSFSAIAVKSELASALSRAGAGHRATAEMDEVKSIAVESMAEMRQLVRGYRDIDLGGEVAGARSLLSATGCQLLVEGDPDKVPRDLHEVAAWAVREGTTNIVKHSSATAATLTLGAVGMSLRNNGAVGDPAERNGLLGLAERLAAQGATLTVDADGDGDEFALEIKWRTA